MAAVTPSRSGDREGQAPVTDPATTPVRSGDAFDVFQIEPAFALDLEDLGRRHRELSRALHPDRYVGRPAAERRRALGRAIEVNEAWRVLRDPVRRGEALLVRLGVATGEESNPPAAPEFLMEMMERRESLRESGRAGDLAAVEKLSAEMRQQEAQLLRELGAAFEPALRQHGFRTPEGGLAEGALAEGRSSEGAAAPSGPAALALRLGELRYLRRFFDEADAFLSE